MYDRLWKVFPFTRFKKASVLEPSDPSSRSPQLIPVSLPWNDQEYDYSPLDDVLVHRKVTWSNVTLDNIFGYTRGGISFYSWLKKRKKNKRFFLMVRQLPVLVSLFGTNSHKWVLVVVRVCFDCTGWLARKPGNHKFSLRLLGRISKWRPRTGHNLTKVAQRRLSEKDHSKSEIAFESWQQLGQLLVLWKKQSRATT